MRGKEVREKISATSRELIHAARKKKKKEKYTYIYRRLSPFDIHVKAKIANAVQIKRDGRVMSSQRHNT